jgi:hypothetical protein
LGYKEKKSGNKARLLKTSNKINKMDKQIKNQYSVREKPTHVIQSPSRAQPQ